MSKEASEFLSDCDTGCTECRKAWYKDSPNDIFGHCVNDAVYRYTNQCKSKHDKSRCSTEEMDFCFKAYPVNSRKKWRDADCECRTVVPFNRQEDFDWKFSKWNKKRNTLGLCKLSSDPDAECAQSWDDSESMKGRGWTSMARVRPSI